VYKLSNYHLTIFQIKRLILALLNIILGKQIVIMSFGLSLGEQLHPREHLIPSDLRLKLNSL